MDVLPFPREKAASIPDYNTDTGVMRLADPHGAELLVDSYDGERDSEGRCVIWEVILGKMRCCIGVLGWEWGMEWAWRESKETDERISANLWGLLEILESIVLFRFHGSGEAAFRGGKAYQGSWKKGAMDGSGRFAWADGSWYEGGFARGLPEGEGHLELGDGTWYEGTFVQGRREGRGVCVDGLTGSRYVGEWRGGLREGRGRLEEPDGSYFDGEWRCGQKEGRGHAHWSDVGDYVGEWRGNVREGRGKMVWANGEWYEGGWMGGLMDGYGVYVWSGGIGVRNTRYEGRFLEGERDGLGTMFYSDGSRFCGEFVRDERAGPGVILRADGSIALVGADGSVGMPEGLRPGGDSMEDLGGNGGGKVVKLESSASTVGVDSQRSTSGVRAAERQRMLSLWIGDAATAGALAEWHRLKKAARERPPGAAQRVPTESALVARHVRATQRAIMRWMPQLKAWYIRASQDSPHHAAMYLEEIESDPVELPTALEPSQLSPLHEEVEEEEEEEEEESVGDGGFEEEEQEGKSKDFEGGGRKTNNDFEGGGQKPKDLENQTSKKPKDLEAQTPKKPKDLEAQTSKKPKDLENQTSENPTTSSSSSNLETKDDEDVSGGVRHRRPSLEVGGEDDGEVQVGSPVTSPQRPSRRQGAAPGVGEAQSVRLLSLGRLWQFLEAAGLGDGGVRETSLALAATRCAEAKAAMDASAAYGELAERIAAEANAPRHSPSRAVLFREFCEVLVRLAVTRDAQERHVDDGLDTDASVAGTGVRAAVHIGHLLPPPRPTAVALESLLRHIEKHASSSTPPIPLMPTSTYRRLQDTLQVLFLAAARPDTAPPSLPGSAVPVILRPAPSRPNPTAKTLALAYFSGDDHPQHPDALLTSVQAARALDPPVAQDAIADGVIDGRGVVSILRECQLVANDFTPEHIAAIFCEYLHLPIPDDNPTPKPTESPLETTEKPLETTEKPLETSTEKPLEASTEKPIESSPEQPFSLPTAPARYLGSSLVFFEFVELMALIASRLASLNPRREIDASQRSPLEEKARQAAVEEATAIAKRAAQRKAEMEAAKADDKGKKKKPTAKSKSSPRSEEVKIEPDPAIVQAITRQNIAKLGPPPPPVLPLTPTASPAIILEELLNEIIVPKLF